MIKALRRKQLSSLLIFELIVFGLGLFLLYTSLPASIKGLRGPIVLEGQSGLSQMVGEYVSLEVKYPLGKYVETTKATKVNGIPTGTKKSYASYLVIDEAMESVISVEVPFKKSAEMDDLSERFIEAVSSTDSEMPQDGIVVNGSVRILEGEDLFNYESAMTDFGFPVEGTIYEVNDGKIGKNTVFTYYGISVLSFAFILSGLFILIRTLKDSIKKKIGLYLSNHSQVRMEQLESDFQTAHNVGTIWVGDHWTFSHDLKQAIMKNADIAWVHTAQEKSGRTTSSYVYWNLADGQQEKIALSSVKKCDQVMALYNKFPHIIASNNPEFAYLYRNDREEFLNQKYNPIFHKIWLE